MTDLKNLKYTKSHEWIQQDGDQVTIGITDFAVKQLTDLVYIDLPDVGRNLTEGETFGEVESVKAVSDLYAPLNGEVVAVNDQLVDDLAVLSDDPFGGGWMIKLKVADSSALDATLDHDAYTKFCESEQH